MLIDELRNQLKIIKPHVTIIKTFWQESLKENEYQTLNTTSTEENFWQHPQRAEILKKLHALKNLRDQLNEIVYIYDELAEFIEAFATDEQELKKLSITINHYMRQVRNLKITFLLSDELDDSNCFFSINAGAGGTESQDWAAMLLRMYLRFCEQENLIATIIDYQSGEEAGIKSATIFIKGKKPYGLLKSEHGVHRLVRISPFDSNKRRHTSFASVFVTPEQEQTDITIQPQDLRIDTYRSSGAGGQHVNTTDSAVRITHIPSGIVVQCQNERSQGQNKETALKMLKAKLIQKQKEDAVAKKASIEKKRNEWGSQIRSYILHPYKLVKDHRTNYESPQPEAILDGDLLQFIEHNLIELHKEE